MNDYTKVEVVKCYIYLPMVVLIFTTLLHFSPFSRPFIGLHLTITLTVSDIFLASGVFVA